MNFFVVDNEVGAAAKIVDLLKRIYPDSEVWPRDVQPLTDWELVARTVQEITDGGSDWVLVLDLGLEPSGMGSVHAGVEGAYRLRSLRPSATIIAYTQWADVATHEPHYTDTFDGLLDKQRLQSYDTRDDECAYVRQVVTGAVRGKAGASPSYTTRDSLGIRLATAALGQEALDALVDDVASTWSEPEVSALTSGHSGAFLLAFSGRRMGGTQRIIVKCARDRAIIDGETRFVAEMLPELGPLAEILAPIDGRVHELPNRRGFYYRQANVSGESLLRSIERHHWSTDARACVDGLLNYELRCYRKGLEDGFGEIAPRDRFTLTAIDTARVRQSLEFLGPAAHQLDRRGKWPKQHVPVEDMILRIRDLANGWKTLLDREEPLRAIAQHGDMNPENVLVPEIGKVILIDFSRLGRWPVGYDIARLATMLRLRLVDCAGHSDWLVNRLQTWSREEFCRIDKQAGIDGSLCPSAVYCDQVMWRFVRGLSRSHRRGTIRGYRLATLWDLLKVLSYSDLSPFKRLWALIECHRLATVLGFVERRKGFGPARPVRK